MPDKTTVYTATVILSSPHRDKSTAKVMAANLIGWQIDELDRMASQIEKRKRELHAQLSEVREHEV